MRFLLWVMVLTGMVMADPHPRLLFPAGREAEVKARIAADPLAAGIQEAVVKRAEKVLRERTCEYLIADGKRLLPEARKALHHVLYCGWAWRTTGDVRFRDRVIRELDAACALKDWNPAHFLDTAEMSTAVAIGYDWLFPALGPEQRKRYEDALLDKGLRVVVEDHPRTKWWVDPINNWSQVCGTGMALAAEAVKERDPELCAALVKHGDELIAKCESVYLPDGAYPEGPSYWHSHNTLVIDGRLQAAPAEGCPVSEIKHDGTRSGSVVDLGRAYEGQTESVKRSAVLDAADGSVRMIDAITKPVGPVRWAVVTQAKAKIEGDTVILEEVESDW